MVEGKQCNNCDRNNCAENKNQKYSLGEFAARQIFEPLGMKHTLVRQDQAQAIENRAIGYVQNAKGEFQRKGDRIVFGAGVTAQRLSPAYQWSYKSLSKTGVNGTKCTTHGHRQTNGHASSLDGDGHADRLVPSRRSGLRVNPAMRSSLSSTVTMAVATCRSSEFARPRNRRDSAACCTTSLRRLSNWCISGSSV